MGYASFTAVVFKLRSGNFGPPWRLVWGFSGRTSVSVLTNVSMAGGLLIMTSRPPRPRVEGECWVCSRLRAQFKQVSCEALQSWPACGHVKKPSSGSDH